MPLQTATHPGRKWACSSSHSCKDLKHRKTKTFPLVIFDLQEDRLLPRNLEARFYLTKLLLWQHDYELAAEALRGTGPLLRSLTVDEAMLLEEICAIQAENGDGDPRSRAVCLLAHYLRMRVHVDFPNHHSCPKRRNPILKPFTRCRLGR